MGPPGAEDHGLRGGDVLLQAGEQRGRRLALALHLDGRGGLSRGPALCIVGSYEEVAQYIYRYKAAGVSEFISRGGRPGTR